ncbi:hypothetical protein N658DRAFT_201430 [Parathielavia hyrcaniae]|uniref:Uncharacterized protein n=1 Tax=Parathielavia hyrcaniae TaxID=113614 RepID=A0AAN6QAC5_9PEZI|nr:hypothetical protein N658DRAFT_201430 [Parathielavia hyrcaniae]
MFSFVLEPPRGMDEAWLLDASSWLVGVAKNMKSGPKQLHQRKQCPGVRGRGKGDITGTGETGAPSSLPVFWCTAPWLRAVIVYIHLSNPSRKRWFCRVLDFISLRAHVIKSDTGGTRFLNVPCPSTLPAAIRLAFESLPLIDLVLRHGAAGWNTRLQRKNTGSVLYC